jgi:hypothetical protein
MSVHVSLQQMYFISDDLQLIIAFTRKLEEFGMLPPIIQTDLHY